MNTFSFYTAFRKLWLKAGDTYREPKTMDRAPQTPAADLAALGTEVGISKDPGHTVLIPALGNQRQKDHEFKVSLNYTIS